MYLESSLVGLMGLYYIYVSKELSGWPHGAVLCIARELSGWPHGAVLYICI